MPQLLVPTHNYDFITPSIAVGSEFFTEEIPLLKTLAFDTVVDVRTESFDDTPTLTEYGINYHRIPAPDCTGFTIEQYKSGTQWIDDKVRTGSRIYMHCKSGLGRSPTMMIAYLIKKGSSLEDAYKFVCKRHPVTLISLGQVKSLQLFKKALLNFPS